MEVRVVLQQDTNAISHVLYYVVVVLVYRAKMRRAVFSHAVPNPLVQANHRAALIHQTAFVHWGERVAFFLSQLQPRDGDRLQANNPLVSSFSYFGCDRDEPVF